MNYIAVDQLTKKIKGKFGTISRFCRFAGIDRYELQILFTLIRKRKNPSEEQRERLAELNRLVIDTREKQNDKDITFEIRHKAKKAIDNDYGGVQNFVFHHPEINEVNVYHLLQGRRKLRTKKINHILNILGI